MNRFICTAAAACVCLSSLQTTSVAAQDARTADDGTPVLAVQALVAPPLHTDHRLHAEREIALGETRVGTLITGDPTLDDGEYYHTWVFNGRADERIVVSLRSAAFDSYLAIFTADGEWEEQDDDSGGDSHARLDVTLPATGRYAIVVTTYAGGEKGDYSLAVHAHEVDGNIARRSTR